CRKRRLYMPLVDQRQGSLGDDRVSGVGIRRMEEVVERENQRRRASLRQPAGPFDALADLERISADANRRVAGEDELAILNKSGPNVIDASGARQGAQAVKAVAVQREFVSVCVPANLAAGTMQFHRRAIVYGISIAVEPSRQCSAHTSELERAAAY